MAMDQDQFDKVLFLIKFYNESLCHQNSTLPIIMATLAYIYSSGMGIVKLGNDKKACAPKLIWTMAGLHLAPFNSL